VVLLERTSGEFNPMGGGRYFHREGVRGQDAREKRVETDLIDWPFGSFLRGRRKGDLEKTSETSHQWHSGNSMTKLLCSSEQLTGSLNQQRDHNIQQVLVVGYSLVLEYCRAGG